ncbi:uncharacterized protein TRAVEDRAFT_54771, partial [Trametes versicolor FP-101664 SS1]
MSLSGYRLTGPPQIHLPVLSVAYDAHPLKRKRSDLRKGPFLWGMDPLERDAPFRSLRLPILFPPVKRDTDRPDACPPSPALTEIIDDVSEDGGPCMERAKAAGVKVRDFAYEPLPKGPDPRAPDVWEKATSALIMHDHYIRLSSEDAAKIRLSGRDLYRLRQLGWVTKREEDEYWYEEDRKAMADYMARPLGPYPFCIPKGVKKPTAAYRATLRLETVSKLKSESSSKADEVTPKAGGAPRKPAPKPEPEPEEDPSKVIDMSDLDDMDDMDDGPPRMDPRLMNAIAWKLGEAYDSSAAAANNADASHVDNADASHVDNADTSHVDKKRRLSAPATPQSTPPASPAPAPGPVRMSSRTA